MDKSKSSNTTKKITVKTIYKISNVLFSAPDWKKGLDNVVQSIRPLFIFDNMVIYRDDPHVHTLDVMYARATGRGRSAEAEISWGEVIANQVVVAQKTILQVPATDISNRLEAPYILGIPLVDQQRCYGTMIFIRFGGPAFSKDSIQLAEYLAQLVTPLVEKVILEAELAHLRDASTPAILQENYISSISHDLRHPLGFIKGYTTTLLRSEVEWDKNSQKEFLRIIDEEADKLSKLIDNLLDSAMLRTGQMRMDFQPVRLDALLKGIITKYGSAYPALKINLQVQPGLQPVWGDPLRLSQVIDNLLDNAIQHAPGSRLDMNINHEQDGAQITLTDYGSGISPEYLPHIFERFYRISGKGSVQPGSGLGLYICKEIIETHHGAITVSSKIGEGTTFRIFLPYKS